MAGVVTMDAARVVEESERFAEAMSQRLNDYTARRYAAVARLFAGYVSEFGEVCAFTDTLAQGFFLSERYMRTGRGGSERTRKQAVSIVRRFLLFMGERGCGDFAPLAERLRERFSTRVPDVKISVLSAEDEVRLKQYLEMLASGMPDEQGEPTKRLDYYTARLLLVCKLALFGGLRLGEMRDMRLGDIMQSGYKYMVRVCPGCDGPAQREVGISVRLIERELDVMRKEAERRNVPEPVFLLFATRNGRKMMRQEFHSFFMPAMKRAGVTLQRGEGVHTLRHTYALNELKKGILVETLRRKLGLKHHEHAREYKKFLNAREG